MKVTDDDIVIHVVDQMYESNWFLEETMNKWEALTNDEKILTKCKEFFEEHTSLSRVASMQRVNQMKAWMRSMKKISNSTWMHWECK